jgi:hypothetical protein
VRCAAQGLSSNEDAGAATTFSESETFLRIYILFMPFDAALNAVYFSRLAAHQQSNGMLAHQAWRWRRAGTVPTPCFGPPGSLLASKTP